MNKKINYPIPSEDEECITFVQWLNLKDIPHAHIANESRSNNRNAIIRGAKLKRMGQSRGVWDYEIFLPIKNPGGAIERYQLVKIEMKRVKNGKVLAEQKEWGKIYEMAGIPCKVCYGAGDAIDYLESLQKTL